MIRLITKNRYNEDIRIERVEYEGRVLYHLDVNNGEFSYTTEDWEDCIRFAKLT